MQQNKKSSSRNAAKQKVKDYKYATMSYACKRKHKETNIKK